MEQLLKGRPSTDREDTAYLSGMIEHLSYLTDEEIGWITHPRDGLHTVCKYLPTPADVAEFVRAKREAANKTFRNPAPTGAYAYFTPDPDDNKPLPESEKERRARVVREALGYNPLDKYRATGKAREFTEPTGEDLENLKVAKPTKSDLTPQLKALLEQEGWPFIPATQEKAA
jgi:hypothetical protein